MAASAAGQGRLVMGLGAAAVLLMPAAALATEGQVIDASGKPVAQAMVTLQPAELALGASIYTVFTDADGRYTLPAKAVGTQLSVRKLGYAPVTLDPTQATKITLTQAQNVADSAPPSAWLPRTGADDLARANTVLQCTSCHQFPSQKVRHYSEMLDGKSEAEKQAAWKAMINYMRVSARTRACTTRRRWTSRPSWTRPSDRSMRTTRSRYRPSWPSICRPVSIN